MEGMSVKTLKEFLTLNSKLNISEIEEIALCFKYKKVKRNEILEGYGQVTSNMYFVAEGCLRLYEIDKKGNEITAYFAFENSFITVLPSFILQKPSLDFLVAHEPSEILTIRRDTFLALKEKHVAFGILYQKFVEFAAIHTQMRIYSFLGMEGIDKLKWVLEHEPKLLQRVSSKAVASYLGMTNSTLSKLKAKL